MFVEGHKNLGSELMTSYEISTDKNWACGRDVEGGAYQCASLMTFLPLKEKIPWRAFSPRAPLSSKMDFQLGKSGCPLALTMGKSHS